MDKKVKLSNLVANDDGSSYHKVSYFAKEGGKLVIKSSISQTNIYEGIPNVALGVAGQQDASVLNVNGQVFTCDEHTPGYDVRSRADHQWSSGIIAMNQHALTQAGFAGKYVVQASGIPVEMYFNGEDGNKDQELLDKKSKAFTNAQILNKADKVGNPTELDESKLVSVLQNHVIPEAVGAYMDLTITTDGQKGKIYDNDVLIIDMGSFTTDIAVIGPGGRIRKEHIMTLEDEGFLSIYDEFRQQASQAKIPLKKIPNKRIEEAFLTGKITVINGTVDVAEIVDRVKDKCITPIIEKIQQKVGADINFLSAVIGVGGGAQLVKEYFGELSDVIDIPEDPQFSNSRGFLKTITYAAGLDVEDDL